MTVYLCGFMGCGKTTVGELLAMKLGVKLIDTDAEIVKKEGRSIPEIFAQDGEAYFRQVEAETIQELGKQNAVISCGGGAILNEKTAEIARKCGVVVLLDENFEDCYERIKEDENRPLVVNHTKEQLEEIFNQRSAIYRAHSTYVVPGGTSPLDMCQRVLKAIK